MPAKLTTPCLLSTSSISTQPPRFLLLRDSSRISLNTPLPSLLLSLVLDTKCNENHLTARVTRQQLLHPNNLYSSAQPNHFSYPISCSSSISRQTTPTLVTSAQPTHTSPFLYSILNHTPSLDSPHSILNHTPLLSHLLFTPFPSHHPFPH